MTTDFRSESFDAAAALFALGTPPPVPRVWPGSKLKASLALLPRSTASDVAAAMIAITAGDTAPPLPSVEELLARRAGEILPAPAQPERFRGRLAATILRGAAAQWPRPAIYDGHR